MQDGIDTSGSHFTFCDDTSCMHLKNSFFLLFWLIGHGFYSRFAGINAEMIREF